ncbi:MAG: methylmalonyl-CoA mutase [Deltaproteobacteria bacterium]|nr:methylmalonyl-CoA mutase [Deltaproteobacteria bacterium]
MSEKKPGEKKPLPPAETISGLPVDLLYSKAPEGLDDRLGKPGEYPFTRGVQPDMYRGRLWTMRQYAGFGSARESNERYKFLLSRGQTGLSVAFDLPTQLGLDPDSPRSKGEVGKVGVSIASLADMRVLTAGITLEQVSTSMTINATAGILLSLYVAVAKEQGANLAELQGTVQNDLLKEFAARGNYIYPPKSSLKLTTDVIEYCARELPKWNPISISGYHIREAGSTAVQEVAFTIANGICYVETALKRGLAIDEFAPRLSFFWNVHNEFLEEVAKFRAARRVWAKLLKERFKAQKSQSMRLRFHAQTAGSTLTAQQPENNIVRVSYQAMAAVLGGCQSLHTNGFDEALALPTEKSARLALRTQQVIGYETGVTKTVDPLAGSFFVESLTDELEKRVWAYLETIEKKGGVVPCIESGYLQSEISASAYRQQRDIESGALAVVGVNKFSEANQEKTPLMRIPEKLGQVRSEEVAAWRAQRDGQAACRALGELEKTVREDRNSMPAILASVEAGCTLGEISDTFRRVFGVQVEWTGV